METEETRDGRCQDEPADAGAPVWPAIRTTHHDDERPARERIAELFERMQPHRQVLQAILERCGDGPCPFAEVRAAVEGLSKDHRSVYSPEGFCDLLERAGALRRVTGEGAPFPEDDPEPRVVVEDGVEYLEAADLPELHYVATDDARLALESCAPVSKIEELFEGEQRYLPVYKLVLLMCAEGEGATIAALDAAIVNSPLVQSPRCYASRFVTFLEAAGALRWEKSGWHVSKAGREALDMLQAVQETGTWDNF